MSETSNVNDDTNNPETGTTGTTDIADPSKTTAETPADEGAERDSRGDDLGDMVAEGLDAAFLGDVDDDEVVGDDSADGPAAPEMAPPDDQLIAIIEALIFASPDPITVKALAKLLDPEPVPRIEAAIAVLRERYDERRGLQVVEIANGYQIVTRSEFHEWVRRLFHERTTQKLSVAALETLAVIAYKQPVTAAEIAEIRSVNTSGVLGTLVDRKLVKIAGRKAVVGRPFMYATTREFLDRFGLRDLNDLPKIEDMADVLGFDPPLLDDGAVAAVLPFDAAGDSPIAAGAAHEPGLLTDDADDVMGDEAARGGDATADVDVPAEADETRHDG